MSTDYNDSKMGPRFVEGQEVKIFDKDDQRWVNGKVNGVSDVSVEIQWEDLADPTDYNWDEIILKGDVVEEWHSRKVS